MRDPFLRLTGFVCLHQSLCLYDKISRIDILLQQNSEHLAIQFLLALKTICLKFELVAMLALLFTLL